MVRFLDNGQITKTGYEKYIHRWKYLTSIYGKEDDLGKKAIVEEIVNDYYNEMVFPMKYLGKKELILDLQNVSLSNCILKENKLIGNGCGYGQNACRNIVNQVLFAKSTGRGVTSSVDMFLKRDRVAATIKFKLDNGIVPYPNNVSGYFCMSGGGVQNFSPEKAKAIYDFFTDTGYVVYDSSCGFGGRLLGSYATRNHLKYVGVEPCVRTYEQLLELDDYCSRAYRVRKSKSNIYCEGSEVFIPEENSFDFSFTSPPYFDLEIYSNENTQSILKYPNYSDWLNGFVYDTMENIRRGLKPGKFVGINIKNLPNYRLYDDWLNISKEVGFVLHSEVLMQIGVNSATGHKGRGEGEKIMILQNIK